MNEIRQTEAFSEWLRNLSDARARARIAARIDRLALGNPGDVAPVGEGGKYPPAEPGALEMEPLEAAVGVADVVRHEVTLFDPAFLLQPQLANTSPKDCPSLRRAPSCGTWE